ncbi:hypothetical protein PFISCL1PPCAC_12736 [Pristionchus fissidentatus]|uniref:Uncharacterized protein n=1 Tax=Pristionchus fissidentatus TaxID=1538716 RepID=A0AAV5VPI9_9BILA|nr:hypothetical protein PFISCL1PPCAC_12736 [Pristionchus fissidentatus]
MFNDIVASVATLNKYPYLILGMVCNAATRKLEWMDGSAITYSKNNVTVPDCIANDPLWEPLLASYPIHDMWYEVYPQDKARWTLLCVAEATTGGPASE